MVGGRSLRICERYIVCDGFSLSINLGYRRFTEGRRRWALCKKRWSSSRGRAGG